MVIKVVLSLLTINFVVKTTLCQFYANQYYENMPQQYYQQQLEPQRMDYEEMEHVHTRRSGRHKQYGSSGGRLPYIEYEYDGEESEECKCSCSRCKDTRKPPKPCCRETCFSCSEMQNPQGHGSVVFVPYPYPLMVPNLLKTTTTTSTTTTTTVTPPRSTTEKTEDFAESEDNTGDLTGRKSLRKASGETINDLILRSRHNLKGDRKYMLTSMRKTKPTWEPKYGIVPIPDNLAEKLMSQLRQVKELQARRF